ncbi:MAG: hypothetical protein V2I40_14150 [Desulfobacteraceae bacterium]|jgi:hypothetical protein|nr:hypothetical protein [Desulfobacteraceae bacterium]
MDRCDFFMDLMVSLDAAFLSQQGFGRRHPQDWGERFFQELSLNHPQWAGEKLPIYMKACEILHYFAFFGRSEEMVPAFHEKPEALLRMVLMLFRYGENDSLGADIREQNATANRGKTS